MITFGRDFFSIYAVNENDENFVLFHFDVVLLLIIFVLYKQELHIYIYILISSVHRLIPNVRGQFCVIRIPQTITIKIIWRRSVCGTCLYNDTYNIYPRAYKYGMMW